MLYFLDRDSSDRPIEHAQSLIQLIVENGWVTCNGAYSDLSATLIYLFALRFRYAAFQLPQWKFQIRSTGE